MNLMELFVKIGVDDQASSKVSTITGKIGGGLKTAASVGVKAITAASTAIIGLTGLAIKNYSEYEQLAGGAGKIFDEMNPQTILSDAQDAYLNMGLSANQYLAVINDVGAAFASTMGDEKGYEAAKTGLQAISDYASGTGKNVDLLSEKFMMITRSTSSYQSIADQFSGILPATSKDFLAQAQAAGLLSDEYTELTKVPINEYQAAVSEMLKQGVADLGLAGNTAAEAMSTISGSLNATKAAWSNLVTGLVDDNADFDALMTNFTGIASAAVGNLLPRMETALKGIGTLIEELMPVIMDEIPTIITDTLPSILDSAVSIVTSIGQGLIDNAELLLNTAVDLILTLAEGLAQGLPQMVPAIVDVVLKIVETLTSPSTLTSLVGAALAIIVALANGIITALPELINAVPQIIANLVNAIVKVLPQIFKAGLKILKMLWNGIKSWTSDFLDNVGEMASDILNELSDGLGNLIQKGLTWIKSLWQGISSWAATIKDKVISLAKALPTKISDGIGSLFSKGKSWIKTIWSGISDWAATLKDKVKSLAKTLPTKIGDGIGSLFKKGKLWIKTIWSGISDWSATLKDKVKSLAETLPQKVTSGIGSLLSKGKAWIKSLWSGVSDWGSSLKDKVKSLATTLPGKIVDGLGSLFSTGGDWLSGLWEGIKNKKDWLINKITNLASDAKQAIKDFFGIKSPSTVMRDEVGRYIAEGIGVGFIENNPIKQIETELNKGLKTLTPSLNVMGNATIGGSLSSGGVSVVQNIYSKAQTAADLMQEAIYQQEKAVYLGV